LFTGSLVEIEYTIIVHPLTRVTYPRTVTWFSSKLLKPLTQFKSLK